MSKSIKIILPLIIIILIAGYVYWFRDVENKEVNENDNKQEQIVEDNDKDQNVEDTDDKQEPEVITSDIDTSDWQTYRNEEYGFEVKYPGNWAVVNTSIKLGNFKGKNKISIRSIESSNIENDTKNDLSDEISLIIFNSIEEVNNYLNKDFIDLNSYLESGLVGIPSMLVKKEINNNMVYEIKSHDLNETTMNFIEDKGVIYEFIVIYNESIEIFNNIINSFELLN